MHPFLCTVVTIPITCSIISFNATLTFSKGLEAIISADVYLWWLLCMDKTMYVIKLYAL